MKITFTFDNPFSSHVLPSTIHADSLSKAIAKAIKAFNKKGVRHPDWSWKIHPDNRKVKRLMNKLAKGERIIFYTDNKSIYFEVTKISDNQRLMELRYQDFIILETHFKGEPTK